MELRSHAIQPFTGTRAIIACAQCGEQLLAPDWSEYLDDRRVRHLWACESCDYRFETIICFPASKG